MAIINHMMKKIDTDVSNLKQGLHPQNLSYWYDKIIKETIEMAPPWLQDKIKVHQDPVLTMKFNLNISKRAVRYFMVAVDSNLDDMPYSTKLYFLKVQEIMSIEMDKSLVWSIFLILGINSTSKYLYPINLKHSVTWSSTNQNILIKSLKKVLD